MHNNYKLIKEGEIEYLQGVCYTYEHKTGVKILHISNNDPIGVIALTFLTPPLDDSGAAHIVEHCILSGSEKYPVKDPCAELAKSSINTYLNAITFDERTMYMIGSYNRKSLYNMMDVYLDALFRPNIYKSKETFLREGWHYEYDKNTDELTVGGVVYNEMRAPFSEPKVKLLNIVKRAVYDNSPMRYSSAGTPDGIPSLTYEKFLEFYNNHYTPDNCIAYCYGDDNFEPFFEKLDLYLNNALASGSFQKPDKISKLPDGDIYVKDTYTVSENEDCANKNYYAFAYILEDNPEHEYPFLCSLLLSSISSPMFTEFMNREICEFIYGEIISAYGLPPFLYIVVQNSKYDIDYVKQAIDEILQKISENGFDKDLMESYFYSNEIHMREKDFGYRTNGIVNAINSASDILRGLNIYKTLDQLNNLLKLKEKALTTDYFSELAKTIVNSNRKVYVSLLPTYEKSGGYRDNVLKNLTESQKEFIKNDNTLKIFSETPDNAEDLRKIPSISLSDIPKEANYADYNVIDEKIIACELESNKMVYVNFLFDISGIPKKSWQTIGLLTQLLIHAGTENYTPDELGIKIGKTCGSYFKEMAGFDNVWNYKTTPVILVNAKTLDKSKSNSNNSIEDIFKLTKEVLLKPRLTDKKKIKEIISQHIATSKSYIIQGGDSSAIRMAASGLYLCDEYFNTIFGIPFLRYITHLYNNFDELIDTVIDDLIKLSKQIFCRNNAKIFIGGEESSINTVKKLSEDFFGEFPVNNCTAFNINDEPFIRKNVRNAFITQSEVSFNAMATRFDELPKNYIGLTQVVSKIISNELLIPEIRLNGGAYGTYGWFGFIGGFCANSYRDPNIMRTYDIFKKVPDFLQSYDTTPENFEKIIIGSMNGYDMPLTQSQRFYTARNNYFTGVTKKYRQTERDSLLNADIEAVRAFAPYIAEAIENAPVCTLSNEDMINKNRSFFDSIEIL